MVKNHVLRVIQKEPHSSLKSPKIETNPKNSFDSGSYSVAYHVPAPAGLKNFATTIGSVLSSCLPSLANLASSSFVSNFIYFHLLSFGPSRKLIVGKYGHTSHTGALVSGVSFARAIRHLAEQFIGGEAGNPCKMRGKTSK